MAFLQLPDAVKRTYTEARGSFHAASMAQVAIDELAAFVNWRRSQVAQQEKGDLPPATEFESGWDLLNIDQKTEWLPEAFERSPKGGCF